jgi:hypothetical protein
VELIEHATTVNTLKRFQETEDLPSITAMLSMSLMCSSLLQTAKIKILSILR